MVAEMSQGGLPAPTSYAAVGWLMMGLASLIVIARNAVGFWRDITRPNGADAITQAATQFQPRGDYITRREWDGKVVGLEREIHLLRGEIAELERRQAESSEERIRSVHARIDALPDRIIAQLSNLHVLRRPHDA